MSADSRVRHLLDQLLDTDATPEEVCGQCPELLPEVRNRWQRVRRLRGDLDALFPPEGVEPPSEDTALPQVPGYRVEALLGRGGMGVVFRAWHLRLNRPVALKMMLAGDYAGPRERERFQREAEAVAGLRHPNVVQVHDVGEADGRPYYTMELVDGGNLAQTLNGTPLPVDRAAELVGTMASAVQAAHATGIVHRDLKPANVLLTTDGTPKVGDFGLARRLSDDAGLTFTGVALGTPSYMAPEQAGGKADAVGPTADVYALGAILYELLTGRPPFRGESAAETVQQLLAHDLVPPSRLNPRVSRDLETVCLKCLQKSPRLRYASAGEVADDLGRFRRGEAITARPDGLVRRWVRRIRHRPVLAAVVAGILVLALATAGAALWVVTERAAAEASAAADRAAVERMAEEDLREMNGHIRRSEWAEARASLERARARLGEDGSADLRHRVERADVEFTLIAKLDAARLKGSRTTGGEFALAQVAEEYETALREAGVWRAGDELKVVADRIKASNVSAALVNAFDGWAALTQDRARRAQILRVSALADPDENGWRRQLQEVARWEENADKVDKAALARVAEKVPADDPRVALHLLLVFRCHQVEVDPTSLLKRIHRTRPNDFWVNVWLAQQATQFAKPTRFEEGVQFYHAAVVLRPDAAIAHYGLGMSLYQLKGRGEEAVFHMEEACRLDPGWVESQVKLADMLGMFKRHAEAIDRLRAALHTLPSSSVLHERLARNLESLKKDNEALAEYRLAIECDRRNYDARKGERSLRIRKGEVAEMVADWKKALAADSPDHEAWYGYAELCLYLGQEDEYRTARSKLLDRFKNATAASIAERVSRACLLRPIEGDELEQAAILAGRTLAADRATYGTSLVHFQFARGLADYRQGRFERVISTMRGEVSKVLGPAPKLVLAMALFQKGDVAEARKELAAAIASHDWSPAIVRDQDGWIYHSLRREAEAMIPADPPTKR